MTTDNNDPPPPPPGRLLPWLPEPPWQPSPMMRRNPNLYMSQDSFVPPPMPPPGEPPANAKDDEFARRLQIVERLSAEVTSEIGQLRKAVEASSVASHEVGIGHNRGPELQLVDEVDSETTHLIALLKDKGPQPPPTDRNLISEQVEKTLGLVDRIKAQLKTAAIAGAMIGLHEVTKDLTAPLWENVAPQDY